MRAVAVLTLATVALTAAALWLYTRPLTPTTLLLGTVSFLLAISTGYGAGEALERIPIRRRP